MSKKSSIVKRFIIIDVILLCILFTILGISAITKVKNKYSCKNCNVILISVDTLRADHLGIYGYKRNTSPNIDSFFNNSIIFTNHISQSNNTLASHMSMFTSLYPQQHGVVLLTDPPLAESITTLPQLLKANGYNTIGFYDSSNHLDSKFGFNRGFDKYEADRTLGNPLILSDLEELKKSKRKFFIFLHPAKNPHDPYLVSESTVKNFIGNKYKGRINANPTDYYGLYFNEAHKKFWENVDKNSPEDIKYLVNLYDAEILETDKFLKRLFLLLEENNQLNNTIVILTADHGEEFMEHGGFLHTKLYDEILQVPLLIRHSNQKTPLRISALTQSVDITPTILDLLGISIKRGFSGKSLVPLLIGKKGKINSSTISQWTTLTAVRTPEWKLIFGDGTPKELYNIKTDTKERDNRITIFPQVVQNLTEEAIRKLGTIRYEYRIPPGLNLDENKKKKLIETGYF